MERNKTIIELRNKGMTYTKLGLIYKISRQRIEQIYKQGKIVRLPKISAYQDEKSHIKNMNGRERNREIARARDNWTCQDCGFRKTYIEVQEHNSKITGLEHKTKSLDIHHTKGLCGKKSKGYDKVDNLDDLVTLCHKCHYNRPEHTVKKKTLT